MPPDLGAMSSLVEDEGGSTLDREVRLRAEGDGPGPGGPKGFVENPGDHHEAQSREALARIASRVTGAPSGVPLSVTICHFRWDPLIARNLFGFHVYDVDSQGDWVDPYGDEGELRYAIALNQSVELQQEVTLIFLLQTAFRHLKQIELAEDREAFVSMDLAMEQEDERAVRAIGDRLRYGWEAAADTVSRRIAEAGFRLKIRYVPDLLDGRDALRRRSPVLRRLYNDTPEARIVIDKMVAMIGRDDPRMAAVAGGSSETRDWLQQLNRLWRVRQYLNHCLRDAEILGNGYLAYSTTEPLGVFNLRPESVLLDKGGRVTACEGVTEFDPSSVTHMRGSRQMESPYGVSVLEPVLPTLKSLDDVRQMRQLAEAIVASRRGSSETLASARGSLELVERMEKVRLKRIRDILWYPLNRLPDPPPSLYFEGQTAL